jgi:hypothetical protein
VLRLHWAATSSPCDDSHFTLFLKDKLAKGEFIAMSTLGRKEIAETLGLRPRTIEILVFDQIMQGSPRRGLEAPALLPLEPVSQNGRT